MKIFIDLGMFDGKILKAATKMYKETCTVFIGRPRTTAISQ